MDNILALHKDLASGTYQHGLYHEFNICDPKPRIIHKATVRDRLLHHAVYRVLYPFFEDTFIADSFSCRLDKGAHRALARFKKFAGMVSQNSTKTCWILKCDIKKFFASVDQTILLEMLNERISDKRIVALLKEVISSFPAGLPLGNLTSQLFSNVYMNEFDQFVKHKLHVKYYIRYADDFVFLSGNRKELEGIVPVIANYFHLHLKLKLHPNKIFIKTLSSGMDFLGWVNFPKHRVLRTVTKKRMFAKLKANVKPERLVSYLGQLKHGNTQKLRTKILPIS